MTNKAIVFSFVVCSLVVSYTNAFGDTSEFLYKKMNRLTATKAHMVEIETIDDSISESSERFISMKKTVDDTCMPAFNKQLSLQTESMNSLEFGKTNFQPVILNLIDLMKKAEDAAMKCGASNGMLIRPYVVTDEGQFSYSNWLQSSLITLQALEVATNERDIRTTQNQENIISRVRACGKSYNYDVEGKCGSERVKGNIDACSNSKKVSGNIKYDNGTKFNFSGEWVSHGEIEGHDGFGNSCDLNIN